MGSVCYSDHNIVIFQEPYSFRAGLKGRRLMANGTTQTLLAAITRSTENRFLYLSVCLYHWTDNYYIARINYV